MSILNEEYELKIKKMCDNIREAYDILIDIPNIISKSKEGEELRKSLAESCNLSNQLKWSCHIDLNNDTSEINGEV